MDLIDACERGWIADPLTRLGMRQLIGRRLRTPANDDGQLRSLELQQFVAELRSSDIAVATDAANQQHYEVPAAFFQAHLGPRLKYSCAWYAQGNETLAQAEEAMLRLSCERAQIHNGQRILDLGCGWGSMSLWLAEQYPQAQITGLSNSQSQRAHIEAQARQRGLSNLRIITGNIASIDLAAASDFQAFDRIVSIEMFEHMKNYEALLAKLRRWLKPDGLLFVHLFAHKLLAYPFEDRGRSDWMSRYFFTGGTMPSEYLLYHFQDDFRIDRHWWISGQHYQRTAEHWLEGMDQHRSEVRTALEQAYGAADCARWIQRWRMFYMAVAELFGYAGGNEWGVVHYCMRPRLDHAAIRSA